MDFLQERHLTIEGLICGFSFGFIIGMYVRGLIYKTVREWRAKGKI